MTEEYYCADCEFWCGRCLKGFTSKTASNIICDSFKLKIVKFLVKPLTDLVPTQEDTLFMENEGQRTNDQRR
jgi:hypothetical protein